MTAVENRAADSLVRAGEETALTGPGGLPAMDLVALARRYEPLLRFTTGEMFYPMAVEAYLEQAALWAEDGSGERRQLVGHGHLTVEQLCQQARSAPPETTLELRYVPGPLRRRRLRQWRRDPNRPRIRAFTRLAAVGLLGRLLDVLFRLSLLVRGRVPGGLVAAAHLAYVATASARTHPYYAHVSVDGGYVVVQYWFFYAMNNWRTSFAGVNDHEGDWEQVTVFLTPSDADGEEDVTGRGDGLRVAWVAFSSHDDTGAELRRRPDDPDLEWVDATHPVVYVGAGSHSGACLPGDYLVRVKPPVLQTWLRLVDRTRNLLMPWIREQRRHGLGIPYVDYKRGDGRAIGPGAEFGWQPVLIDATTDWVRDYRGTWGLDTDDPFGGERAPAGPRYERDGAIRESWADPVAWAGLDAVPATEADRRRLARERLAELEARGERLDALIATQQERVRRQAVSAPGRVSGGARRDMREGSASAEATTRLQQLRAERRAVHAEHEHLLFSRAETPLGPHAHLSHRGVPDTFRRNPHRLLRVWSEISLSVLLGLLGLALLFDVMPAYQAVLDALLIVLAIEAMLRRRLLVFLLGVAMLAAIVVLLILLVTNFRVGIGALAVVAAVGIGVANLRSLLSRR